MPRPKKPDAKTASERATASRIRRRLVGVQLPPEAITAADIVRLRDGDASRVAAIVRVLREAAGT